MCCIIGMASDKQTVSQVLGDEMLHENFSCTAEESGAWCLTSCLSYFSSALMKDYVNMI